MSFPNPAAPDPLDGAFSAAWLMCQDIPPVEYVVPGVVPEGLTLLVAPPKIGKSWMVLGIAVAVAEGGRALGKILVDSRPVLYLALEDGPGRLQRRLSTLGVTAGSDRLILLPTLDAPVPLTIGAFLERNADRKPLVILDTLGKVRGTYGGNDAYGHDYSQMSSLKDLVDRVPGSSLIVVHHTNKGEKTDFLDSVSGTQGLAGAADSIIAIKRERGTGEASLHVTSRDAAEGEYAITLTDGTWQLDGDGLHQSSERAALRAVTGGLGDEMTDLVATVSKYPEGIRRQDIEQLFPQINAGTLGKNLRRAVEAGRLANPSRGLYTPAITATSATNYTPDTRDVALMALVAPPDETRT